MKGRFVSLIVILLSVYGIAAVDGFASTLVVTKTTDTADGICDGDCSLREAVVAANSGDTIIFSTLFDIPQTIALINGQIVITKDLTIAGPGVDRLSISGAGRSRIFLISRAVVTASGMKVRDGRVDDSETLNQLGGGGIRVRDGGNLTLRNAELTGNTAFHSQLETFGGAIYVEENSTITLDGVNVHHNTADTSAVRADQSDINIDRSIISDNAGGGVFGRNVIMRNSTARDNSGDGVAARLVLTLVDSKSIGNYRGVNGIDNQGVVTIDRCLISDSLPRGGFINFGFATVRNTVIINNGYVGSGGGITNAGTMYVIDSSITGNRATEQGGGIENVIGQLFLTNSTVSGNFAGSAGAPGRRGGGIHNDDFGASGRVTISNSTISGNSTTGLGGGLSHESTNLFRVTNSIISGNASSATTQEDVSGTFTSQGYNLIGDTTGGLGWVASDILNQNPLLAPLGNNGHGTFTHALLPGSPAINAGNNAFALDPQTMFPLVFDQRGFARFTGTVDIGAYEAFYSSSPVTVGGRVLRSNGRGISGARVTLTEPGGTIRYAVTNPFGHYRFNDLTPGTTYTVTATSKSYQFTSPQIVTADQNRSDLDFTATL